MHYKQLRRAITPAVLAAFGVLACSEAPTEQRTVPEGLRPRFAASPGVNLDQWANGSPAPTGESWQNGNLNGNNSTYAERRAVPFRLAIEGLTAGTHTIYLNYDFTAGGHKAYDYLASIDATEPNALAQICAVGGGGRSSLCGTNLTTMPGPVPFEDEPFPGDPFSVDGKTVDQAITDGAVPRDLRIYGGTITSIQMTDVAEKDDQGNPIIEGDGHVGPTTGNSTGQMLVTFVSNGSAVLLAWSGHLAYSVFWNGPNDPDGAGEVSGAPWHMRSLNLDFGGAANQDRSIQPSAIVEVVADARISISTSGVNEISTWHPMTGHVDIDAGAGFVNAPDGTVITFSVASGPGIIVGSSGSTTALGPPATCTTAGGTGSCTVYLYSTTTGLTTVNASTSVDVNGVTVERSTDGAAENSGPLTKQWVDAQIDLSPLTATNKLADNHVVTATVQQDDGLPAGAPGDGATGFGPAPDGTLVTFSLLNNTAGATFVGGVNTCTTTSGTCSITIQAANAGGVDIHATTTFSINGESVTRASDGTGLNSADAHKDWEDAEILITKTGDELSKIGDQVTYTFKIENKGSVAVTLVSLMDTKLGDLSDDAPDACDAIAAGAFCEFTVDHTIPAGASDPYDNTVTAVYDAGSTSGEVSDTDSHSVNLFQPSILVTKTSATTQAVVGQSVSYTFTIQNTSSADSPNLILASAADNVLGDLATDAANATPSCSSLASGESCSFSKSRAIAAGDADPLVNTFTVHYNPSGFPNDITDSDDHSVDVLHPSFTVTKACAVNPVPLGVASSWVITVTNNGDADLAIDVQDLQIDVNTQETLAAGASKQYTGTGATSFTSGAVLTNTATVSASISGTSYSQQKTADATCTYQTVVGQPSIEIDQLTFNVGEPPSNNNTMTGSFRVTDVGDTDSFTVLVINILVEHKKGGPNWQTVTATCTTNPAAPFAVVGNGASQTVTFSCTLSSAIPNNSTVKTTVQVEIANRPNVFSHSATIND